MSGRFYLSDPVDRPIGSVLGKYPSWGISALVARRALQREFWLTAWGTSSLIERILIIDTDTSVREQLDLGLSERGLNFPGVATAAAALEFLAAEAIDLILCDRRIPGIDGFDLAAQLARRFPEIPLILTSDEPLTGFAAEALKRGAYDALSKPLDLPELRLAIHRLQIHADVTRKNRLLERELDHASPRTPIVAASEAMIHLLESLERTSEFKNATLLMGETGTRKELLARAIHSQSSRRSRSFVQVDSAAGCPGGITSELFGSEKQTIPGPTRNRTGLFVQAEGGTVYLGRVEALPHETQGELVRALKSEEIWPLGGRKPRPIDIRVIAGTDIDLEEATREGRFSSELFDLFSASRVEVPALRYRREDIPLLVDHFFADFGRKIGRPGLKISDLARDRLIEYGWPGNLRELENTVEKAALAATTDLITPAELPREITEAYRNSFTVCGEDFSLKKARQEFEALIIRRALEATQGNRTHAARLLEISHRALLYKIKAYEIRD